MGIITGKAVAGKVNSLRSRLTKADIYTIIHFQLGSDSTGWADSRGLYRLNVRS